MHMACMCVAAIKEIDPRASAVTIAEMMSFADKDGDGQCASILVCLCVCARAL